MLLGYLFRDEHPMDVMEMPYAYEVTSIVSLSGEIRLRYIAHQKSVSILSEHLPNVSF
jgi:hypothetical protein